MSASVPHVSVEYLPRRRVFAFDVVAADGRTVTLTLGLGQVLALTGLRPLDLAEVLRVEGLSDWPRDRTRGEEDAELEDP